jgi:hypothetical protein
MRKGIPTLVVLDWSANALAEGCLGRGGLAASAHLFGQYILMIKINLSLRAILNVSGISAIYLY